MKSPYQNFVVIDVETGGLPNKTKKAFYDVALTEIAIVSINSELEIVDKKSWLIKPYKQDLEFNPEAAKVSGITKQMCEQSGLDLELVHKELVFFLKANKLGSSLPVVLGHNFIKFDSEFMINMFEYLKDDFVKYVNPEPEDTMKWSRLVWPESVNYKLGTCCENANVVLTDAHRALTDTVATANLFIKFMKNLRGLNIMQSNIEVKRFRDGFEI